MGSLKDFFFGASPEPKPEPTVDTRSPGEIEEMQKRLRQRQQERSREFHRDCRLRHRQQFVEKYVLHQASVGIIVSGHDSAEQAIAAYDVIYPETEQDAE